MQRQLMYYRNACGTGVRIPLNHYICSNDLTCQDVRKNVRPFNGPPVTALARNDAILLGFRLMVVKTLNKVDVGFPNLVVIFLRGRLFIPFGAPELLVNPAEVLVHSERDPFEDRSQPLHTCRRGTNKALEFLELIFSFATQPVLKLLQVGIAELRWINMAEIRERMRPLFELMFLAGG